MGPGIVLRNRDGQETPERESSEPLPGTTGYLEISVQHQKSAHMSICMSISPSTHTPRSCVILLGLFEALNVVL